MIPVFSLALAFLVASSGPASQATQLSFGEMFEASPRELRPSPKLHAVAGRRVRLRGFMARLETPPLGAFYLAENPIDGDEAGGGTGDLPPTAVYVIVRSLAGQIVPFAPRRLEVTGVLEVGYQVEPDGRATHLRLVLDRLQDLPHRKSRTHPHRSRPSEIR